MENSIYTLLPVTLALGIAIGYIWNRKNLRAKKDVFLAEAKQKAEEIKKEKIAEAKETLKELKEEQKITFKEKKEELQEFKSSLQKEREEQLLEKNLLIQKEENLKAQERSYLNDKQTLEQIKKRLLKEEERLKEEYKKQNSVLSKIANLSPERAKEQLVQNLQEEAEIVAQKQVQKILEDAKISANNKAKQIVLTAIQNIGVPLSIDASVSVFHLDDNKLKGRIIGREGRNIRTIEACTGVELVVDDTPESILISSFDPLKREIARLSLHQLVSDGRIHPASIESTVAKVTKQLEDELIETGEQTCIDLGLHNMHNNLIRLIGKMKYRSSYGQNLLQHSIETANLCAAMATELHLDHKLAKRAGLLHDIGKVMDDSEEDPHAIAGMKLAQKCDEHPEVCNAIGSHHEEIEMDTLIAPIVLVCDAISGARPGVRKEVIGSYLERIKQFEEIALSYPGVEKVFAVQAGKELRVIVGSEDTNDEDIAILSNNIANKIQKQSTYPGQVKVTVIRETRSVSVAR